MPAMMATNRHRGLSACIRGWPTASRGATAAERDADSAACHLQIKAASHATVNEALIPTGTKPVTGIYDLNDGPTLEGRAFDDAWVDVERAADGYDHHHIPPARTVSK